MVVYTPEERGKCAAALLGTGISEIGLDANLDGVLRMLAGQIEAARGHAQEAGAQLAIQTVANMALVHERNVLQSELDGMRQAVWILVSRCGGQVEIQDDELVAVPQLPGLTVSREMREDGEPVLSVLAHPVS